MVDIADTDGGDAHAVAQHRDRIGDAEDLVEVMRDEHHGVAGLGEVPDRSEQLLHIASRQRGGGLVEHDDRRIVVLGEGAGDGDTRAVGDAELTDRAPNVERGPRSGDEVPGRHPRRLPVDGAAAPARVAPPEHDVLGDAEVIDQSEVLVNEPHVEAVGVARRSELEWLAVHRGRCSGIGLVVPGEHLDERRLAGSVLADERVDLSFGDGHADVVEDDLTGERLRQVMDLERAHGTVRRPRAP